jgi:hypothetical protein
MSARKPLEEGCTGGIFCPMPGHVRTRSNGLGRATTSHIMLTRGQSKTLRERRQAERESPRA